MITEFTILGERCSGTNFLHAAISENFRIEVTWKYGWKHWFSNRNYINSENTLFIGIVRNPHTWIDSLFRNPYHIPSELLINETTFLNNEFYSISPEGQEIHGERFKNIFECRAIKTCYLLDEMPKLVKNYIFIRYEDLKNDYLGTIMNIQEKFNLEMSAEFIKPIRYYKDIKDKVYVEYKDYKISQETVYNHPNLNIEIERRLNYC